MEKHYIPDLIIRNAEIFRRNFAGREVAPYNPKGKRNFCIFIPEEDAEKMRADGWNVKQLRPRNDDEDPRYFLNVQVRYDPYPPKIEKKVQGGKPILLEEEDISDLDKDEIVQIHAKIHPSWYKRNGEYAGVSAYLSQLLVTVAENPFKDYYEGEENLEDDSGELPY